jgi:hypothetical protein
MVLEHFRFSSNRETLYPFVFHKFPTENHDAVFLDLPYFGNLQNAMDLSPLVGDLICTVHSPPGK